MAYDSREQDARGKLRQVSVIHCSNLNRGDQLKAAAVIESFFLPVQSETAVVPMASPTVATRSEITW